MAPRTTPRQVGASGEEAAGTMGLGFAEPAPLRRVLMHAPGDEIDSITPSNYHRYLFEDAVDPDRFRAQHRALVDMLRSEGVEVILVEDLLRGSPHLAKVEGAPNLVYTRDTVTVTRAGRIRMRMRSPIRRQEPAIVASALDRLGVPTLLDIRAPDTMEGGDLIFPDEETLLVGVGNRTSRGAVQRLRALAEPQGLRTTVAIPLPRWAVHLDGTMMVVDRDLAIVHRDSLVGLATVYEAGRRPQRMSALRCLERRGIRFVEVTAYERQRRATNVVTLGPRRLVGYAGHARVHRALEKEGVDLIEIEGSELVRGGGGPRCMTAPIERETDGTSRGGARDRRRGP